MADVYFRCDLATMVDYQHCLKQMAKATQENDKHQLDHWYDTLRSLPDFPNFNPDTDHVKPVLVDEKGEEIRDPLRVGRLVAQQYAMMHPELFPEEN